LKHQVWKVAYWNKYFPGKGAAILKILRPFKGKCLELQKAMPDLESRAKSAIFWCEIKEVVVLRHHERNRYDDYEKRGYTSPHYLPRALRLKKESGVEATDAEYEEHGKKCDAVLDAVYDWAEVFIDEGYAAKLNKVLRSTVKGHLFDCAVNCAQEAMDKVFNGTIHEDFEERIRVELELQFQRSLHQSIRRAAMNVLKARKEKPLRTPQKPSSVGILEVDRTSSLVYTLIYPIAMLEEGLPEESAKCQPLLDLWLGGNFPEFIDQEKGILYILVAD
jgi:hypothetical protein